MKCIVEICENKILARGLCRKCYDAASNLVNTTKLTWEYLESVGLAKNKNKSNFTKQLKKTKNVPSN